MAFPSIAAVHDGYQVFVVVDASGTYSKMAQQTWPGCTTEYLPVPMGGGWRQLAPTWEPDQTVNPRRRYEPGASR
jgi:hypothetical protein